MCVLCVFKSLSSNNLQMTYALCLQYVNAWHFQRKTEILGNFILGMIFFQSIFGYLTFSIIYKWLIDWESCDQSPPSLLNIFIFMFLSPGKA
jgi:V-type H+-transporting ATPase subunit a